MPSAGAVAANGNSTVSLTAMLSAVPLHTSEENDQPAGTSSGTVPDGRVTTVPAKTVTSVFSATVTGAFVAVTSVPADRTTSSSYGTLSPMSTSVPASSETIPPARAVVVYFIRVLASNLTSATTVFSLSVARVTVLSSTSVMLPDTFVFTSSGTSTKVSSGNLAVSEVTSAADVSESSLRSFSASVTAWLSTVTSLFATRSGLLLLTSSAVAPSISSANRVALSCIFVPTGSVTSVFSSTVTVLSAVNVTCVPADNVASTFSTMLSFGSFTIGSMSAKGELTISTFSIRSPPSFVTDSVKT